MDHYGLLSLLPPILSLVLALWSKNVIFALFCGIISSSIITNGFGFLDVVLNVHVMQGITGNASMFIYLFTFGIFIAAIKKAGGFAAFSRFAEMNFNSPKKSKLLTFLLSGLVINQTIGTIGIGAIMRPVTDRHKVAREKLGFILSSTAEPVVSLVPITIYVLFFGGLISGALPDVNGQEVFVSSIIFNFFSIISIVWALLSSLEIIPDVGYMKKCEERVQTTGQLIREGSAPMDTKELDEMQLAEGVKGDILAFVLPFAVFFATIVITFIQTGMFTLTTAALVGVLVAIIYPIIRGYFKFTDIGEIITSGCKSMAGVVLVLALAFGFGNAVNSVGFANFIVEIAKPLLNASVLPAVVFVICCVGSYATGSLVSAAVVLAPVALSLAVTMGANLPLVVAALVAGSTFGDTSSPLSDMVIESAMGASVDVIDLGKAQLIPKFAMAAISLLLYLIFGFVMI